MGDLSVTEMHCQTAKELFELLSPASIYDKAQEGQQFVFRGQSCDQQLLIPTSYRAYEHFNSNAIKSKETQSEFERKVLLELYEASNKSGLAIPNYDTVEHYLKRIDAEWPPRDLYQMIAFAQHHGIPTRFLDWSYMPYVAVFFAASGVISAVAKAFSDIKDKVKRGQELEALKEKKLAIWQLQLSRMLECSPYDRQNKLVVVRTHAASSVNLAPQGGVFTLTRSYEPNTEISRPEFIESLNEIGLRHALTKNTVPYTQALALLRMCGALGINAATLFPGVDGVVRKTMQQLDINKTEAFFQHAKE